MIDSLEVIVYAGYGGDGCVSFRREKYVPRGGPDGGDGGSGGDVVLAGDGAYNTLSHLKGKRVYRAGRGGHGRGKDQKGAGGQEFEMRVPGGTQVWWCGKGEEKTLLVDVMVGQRVVVARGGIGGRGNACFVSPTNQEPRLAERGEEGEVARLLLEVKLIADVGFIGCPNAGKSTLLAACSRARPKIADYPFTTVEPVLGIVSVGGRTFTAVEIPGLLEGAHRGVGLGHRFLRHAERTRVFIHLVDGLVGDPLRAFWQTVEEMRLYLPSMAERPQLLAVNKVDITEVRERLQETRAALEPTGCPLFFISAATGEGVRELMRKALEVLDSLPPVETTDEDSTLPVVRPRRKRERVAVERQDGVFAVHFSRAERLAARVDVDDHRVRMQLMNELRRMGVVRALEAAGVKQGDTVRLGRIELEW